MNWPRKVAVPTALLFLISFRSAEVWAADISGTYPAGGTASNGDTWTTNHVSIAGGQTFTIPTGATVTFDSGSPRDIIRTGSGTANFTIASGATLIHSTNTDIRPTAGTQFNVSGTFSMTSGTTNDLDVQAGGAVVVNSTGKITSSGSGSRVFGRNSTTSVFTLAGGTLEATATGNLLVDFALGGGMANNSTSGSFEAVDAGSTVQLAGGGSWTGTYSGSGAGKVQLNNFSVGAAGVTLNFSGAGAVADDIRLAGNTLTNTGRIVHDDAPTTGDGLNDPVNGTGTFLNQGVFEFLGGGDWDVETGQTLNNTATGVIRKSGVNTQASAIFGNGTFTNTGEINVLSGTIEIGDDQTNSAASSDGGTYTGGGTLAIAGKWSKFTGAASGGTTVIIGSHSQAGVLLATAPNTEIGVTGDGAILRTVNTNGNIVTITGGTLRIDGADGGFSGSGSVINNGTIINTESNNDLDLAQTGVFTNNGEIRLNGAGSNSDVDIAIGAGNLINSGLIVSNGTGGRVFGRGQSLDNQGTLQVNPGAILNVGNIGSGISLVLTQFSSGTTLTGGTYIADGGTMNLLVTNGNQVATIGSAANVVLKGTGTINKIGSSLVQVDGGFELDDNKTFTTGGALGVGAGGNVVVSNGSRLNVGAGGASALTLNGTLAGDQGTVAASNITGSGTISPGLSAGVINIESNLSLGDGTYFWELGDLASNDTSGAAGVDWDLISMQSGNVDVSSMILELNFDLLNAGDGPDGDPLNPFWQVDHEWLIVSLDGGANSGNTLFSAGQIVNGIFDSGVFSTFLDEGEIFLRFRAADQTSAAVPEPHAVAIWCLLTMTLVGSRCGRRCTR